MSCKSVEVQRLILVVVYIIHLVFKYSSTSEAPGREVLFTRHNRDDTAKPLKVSIACGRIEVRRKS